MKCKKIYIGTYIVAKLFRENSKRVTMEKGLSKEAATELASALTSAGSKKYIVMQEFHTIKYFRFVAL